MGYLLGVIIHYRISLKGYIAREELEINWTKEKGGFAMKARVMAKLRISKY